MSNDLTIYETHGASWWDASSPFFRSLQQISPFRLDLLRDWIGDLRGSRIVDCGCGGGLLSMPMIEAGAEVIGIDRSPRSIETACARSAGRGVFQVGDIRRTTLATGSADVVLLADVLDHLPDYHRAVAEAARIVRHGGTVFVSTLNRNRIASILAVHLGEGLGLIPRGTHDPRLFITPEELTACCTNFDLHHVASTGEIVDLPRTIWHWAITFRRGPSMRVAYAMLFRRGQQ